LVFYVTVFSRAIPAPVLRLRQSVPRPTDQKSLSTEGFTPTDQAPHPRSCHPDPPQTCHPERRVPKLKNLRLFLPCSCPATNEECELAGRDFNPGFSPLAPSRLRLPPQRGSPLPAWQTIDLFQETENRVAVPLSKVSTSVSDAYPPKDGLRQPKRNGA
jgi:hypothetical protein